MNLEDLPSISKDKDHDDKLSDLSYKSDSDYQNSSKKKKPKKNKEP